MPITPYASACDSSTTPFASSCVIIGALSVSASRTNGLCCEPAWSEVMPMAAWWPSATTMRRVGSAIASAACRIRDSLAAYSICDTSRSSRCIGGSTSGRAWMSTGSARCTAVCSRMATAMALRSIAGTADSETITCDTASPAARNSCSWWIAWNSERSIACVVFIPVSASTGTRSCSASMRPVVRFEAPGPDVATQTASLPVSFASAAAASDAAPSLRVYTHFRSLWFVIALMSGMTEPPCPPYTQRTPCCTSESAM